MAGRTFVPFITRAIGTYRISRLRRRLAARSRRLGLAGEEVTILKTMIEDIDTALHDGAVSYAITMSPHLNPLYFLLSRGLRLQPRLLVQIWMAAHRPRSHPSGAFIYWSNPDFVHAVTDRLKNVGSSAADAVLAEFDPPITRVMEAGGDVVAGVDAASVIDLLGRLKSGRALETVLAAFMNSKPTSPLRSASLTAMYNLASSLPQEFRDFAESRQDVRERAALQHAQRYTS